MDAVPGLAPEEEMIRRAPVSERLRQAFLDDFIEQRREAQTTEMLFDRVGAFALKEHPAPKGVEASGFRGIVFKGPFVDGSNWLQDSTWSYATAMERHLAQRFDRELQAAVDGRSGADVEREIRTVLRAFDTLARDLVGNGFRPTLFILAGELGGQLYRDVESHIVPEWSKSVQEALRTTYRIMGMYGDVPVLYLPDTLISSMYAVDLARFAALTRYGYGPDFKPEFDIKPFDDDEAREVLARQPRLIMNPPPDSGRDDERAQQLQLRVGLDLWETYALTVKDPRAVAGRPFVGPILD
jgi:hypothetical protein